MLGFPFLFFLFFLALLGKIFWVGRISVFFSVFVGGFLRCEKSAKHKGERLPSFQRPLFYSVERQKPLLRFMGWLGGEGGFGKRCAFGIVSFYMGCWYSSAWAGSGLVFCFLPCEKKRRAFYVYECYLGQERFGRSCHWQGDGPHMLTIISFHPLEGQGIRGEPYIKGSFSTKHYEEDVHRGGIPHVLCI